MLMAGIVIRDDSPLQFAVLDQVLRAAGHRAYPAPDLPAALRQCREQSVDLLLVELLLQRGNGYSQAAFLQRRTGVPAALMVSRQQPAELRWAERRGLYAVISRPRPPALLLRAIEQVLAEALSTAAPVTDRPPGGRPE